MLKYLTGIVFLAISGAAFAEIPPAVLQSKALANAKACMTQLVADGRSAKLAVDSPSAADVTIMDPSESKLLPLAEKAVKCLDTNLPNKEVRKREDNNQPTQIWYTKVDESFIYCVTPDEGRAKNFVSPLGGKSARRAWAVITYRCNVKTDIKIEFN